MITSPVQAEHILVTGQADVVVIAREFLRDPYWPLRAARKHILEIILAVVCVFSIPGYLINLYCPA